MLDLSNVQSKEDALLLKSVFESVRILRSYRWFKDAQIARCKGGWVINFTICESLCEEVEVTATDIECLMSISPSRIVMCSVIVKNEKIVLQVQVSSYDQPVTYTSIQIDKIRKRQKCF
jgi:hypothetical protein